MTAKHVLNKILGLLSSEEVLFTDARTVDGTILQSPTFDLGEDVEVVHEDGTKTPAPDGEHEIALRDSEGKEVIIRIETKDGKITQRENVEESDSELPKEEEMEDVKTEEIPQQIQKEKVNEVPDAKGSVKSGTLKMAEETEEVEGLPETEDKSMEEEGEEKEISIELGKKMEEMAYRIQEMEAKIAKMEEMYPPVASEVVQEEEGIKMSEIEEEELPKLDGAPIEENAPLKFSSNNKNKRTVGKDNQSSFLSKLYN